MKSAAAEIRDLYERHAYHRDQDRGRGLFEQPWLDRFLNLAPPGSSILDVGRGSPEPIAPYFIEQGNKVTGVDSSPSLIKICQHRFPRERWIVSDMRELCLNARFEALIAWDSLFHLCPEDQGGMFELLAKHSAPKAILMFTSGPGNGEPLASIGATPLPRQLGRAEYRQLLNDHGFAVLEHIVHDPTCGHHTIWLAQLR